MRGFLLGLNVEWFSLVYSHLFFSNFLLKDGNLTGPLGIFLALSLQLTIQFTTNSHLT